MEAYFMRFHVFVRQGKVREKDSARSPGML